MLPDVSSFEWWVMVWFDHDEPNFYQPDYEILDDLPLATRAAYFTRLCTDCAAVLAPYSAQQINASLWTMANELGVDVLETGDEQAIYAIYTLYERLFAVRCDPILSAGAKTYPDNPLNMICYMWWDIFPTWGQPENPQRQRTDALLLDVMARTLDLESVACQEAALHGLGHWHLHYPRPVEAIIDAYLKRRTIPEALRDYARYARAGCVQ